MVLSSIKIEYVRMFTEKDRECLQKKIKNDKCLSVKGAFVWKRKLFRFELCNEGVYVCNVYAHYTLMILCASRQLQGQSNTHAHPKKFAHG